MMELFSNRLDILHTHQATSESACMHLHARVTSIYDNLINELWHWIALQELQMARQEVGKVQEMLIVTSQHQEEVAEEAESSENKEQRQQTGVGCH